MIHNLYVFDENGLPLLTIKLGSIEADGALLTGFLSAMQSFSKKISQGDVEEINFKDFNFHIRSLGSLYVALVADKTDHDIAFRLAEVSSIVEKHKDSLSDNAVQTDIKNAITKKVGIRDRAKDWANIGL
ncbi:MAG: hypothetical protein WED05_09330 [Candidatus Atabeyarchaeum deiterrae]